MSGTNKTSKTTVGRIDAEVLAFTAGKDPLLDLVLTEADCLGTAAHVTMLSRLAVRPRLFAPAEAKKVVRELVRIMRSARRGAFRITAEDQDVHLAVERVLTSRLGALGKKVHTGRSRNDQVAVDLRIFAKVQILETVGEAADLAGELLAFAGRHSGDPMVGRTHLQPAMPSSVGLWASAHAESLLDDSRLLISAYDVNDECPLGAAAGYGVPIPVDRKLVSDLLGFSRPCHNVLYAGNARGKVESVVLSAMSQVMLSLSRLAQDLVVFAMPEFGYFKFPAAYGTGSSIMPQKNNPDVLELVRAKAARVMAAAAGVYEIVRALPSGYSRDLQETKELLLEGIGTTRASLRIMARLVRRLKIDRKALLAGFGPGVYATDHALKLVAGGMPFRDAYQHVKRHLDELGRMDPHAAIAAKKSLGAPGDLALRGLETRLVRVRTWASSERKAFNRSVSRLLGRPYAIRS